MATNVIRFKIKITMNNHTLKKVKRLSCDGCGHYAGYHYRSNVDVTKGRVICSKDNCTGWDRCSQDHWEDEDLKGKH